MKNVDLLFKTPDEGADCGASLLYSLSLDRAFGYVEPDIVSRTYFLKCLEKPPVLRENIVWRQEIMRELSANVSLLPELRAAAAALLATREDFRRERSHLYSLSRVSDANARSALVVAAVYCCHTADRLRGLSDILKRYTLHSKGLQALCCRLYDICENAAFAELRQIAEELTDLSQRDTYEITVALDSACRLASDELSHVTRGEIRSGGGRLKRFFSQSRGEPSIGAADRTAGLRFGAAGDEAVRNDILGGALRETTNQLSDIVFRLLDEFCGLADELKFYAVGLAYERLLRQKDVTLCTPEITAEEALDCRALRDLWLCVSEPTADGITANDVSLPAAGGIMIKGENGAGKTVYLRAAGIAQLLAQSGLPVPAESASAGVRLGIYSQFAASEKETVTGEDAGRFEQEVSELAAIVGRMRGDSLILLNETFQTTAYAEGAEGLYHILRHFTSRGVGWLLVTHLTALYDAYPDGEAVKLRAGKDFRMERCT